MVKGQIATTIALLYEAELAVSGFLLTRERGLQPADGVGQLTPAIEKLYDLIADPTQLEHAKQVVVLMWQRPLKELREFALSHPAAAVPFDLLGRSRAVLHQILAELRTMEDLENKLLEARVATVQRTGAQLVTAMIAGALLGVIGAAGTAMLLGASFVRRISLLKANADRLAVR